MNGKRNSTLTKHAQSLRKEMTKEERHLWYDFLKSLPIQFYRQKVISNYIADFYCAEKKLIIEVDGSQHFEDDGKQADLLRDTYFKSLGLMVLRYSNRQINQEFSRVCEDIWQHITTSSTACGGPPSPQGEGLSDCAGIMITEKR